MAMNRSELNNTNRIALGEYVMPNRWLQIKGDPSVRGFLFQQQRVESLCDAPIDRIHEITHTDLYMNMRHLI